MDETTKAVIDSITIQYPSPRKIPSGDITTTYFDCSRLSPNELARLAAEATGHLGEDSFDVAVGIAYQGIYFASAVAGGRHVAILQADGVLYGPDLKGKRVVLVDDIVHSGSRLRGAAQKVNSAGATLIGYACIIDRSEGKFADARVPLWSAYQTNML